MFASNGILFIHEGQMRGETLLTRKIARVMASIRMGLKNRLHVGDWDA